MTLRTMISFAMTCLIIEITPGPNMAYLAVLSASKGRRAGLAAAFGVALGLSIVGIVAAFGLAAVFSQSRLLYDILRWGGICYLLWLAWEGWREATTGPTETVVDDETVARVFKRGLITNLLNPKAAIFYIAVLPSFVEAALPALTQTLLLSAVYVAIATGIHVAIVALAGTFQPFLVASSRLRLIRRGLALILVAIAIWFAFSTAR